MTYQVALMKATVVSGEANPWNWNLTAVDALVRVLYEVEEYALVSYQGTF